MRNTGRHADVPPEPPGPGAEEFREYARRAEGILGRYERIAGAAEAGLPLPDGTDAHAVALLIRDARQLGSGLHALAAQLGAREFGSGADAVALALARLEGRAEGAQAVRGRHRQDRRRKPPGGQVIPFPGKTVAATAAAAAVTAALTLGPGAVRDLAHLSPAPAARHAPAAALPYLGPHDAVRLADPSPSAYVPRHAKPSADAASATPDPSPSLPPPASPPPAGPSPRHSAAPPGILDVQTVQVVIGPDGHGQIVFSAAGGPVWWQASPSSPGLSLRGGGGYLADRQPGVIRVTVAPGSPAGAGSVTITWDGQSVVVPVTWTAVPGIPA